MSDFEGIWKGLDEQVSAGRLPGYVAAVRLGEQTQVRAGGAMSLEPESPPMTADSLFRIASLTKPLGAVLTFSLIEEGLLSLDDEIARWLPEAGHPRVLTWFDGSLDDTTPVREPITVRHLLAGTSGWGCVLDQTPLQAAMFERGVFPNFLPRLLSADEFAAGVCGLPLAFQPGDGWLYETGIDLLGILITRLTGRSLSEEFAERVTGPLGMTSTAFWTTDTDRLATAYNCDLTLIDPPSGVFSRPSGFEEMGSGLVSTAPDLLRFFTAMADGGAPLVSEASVSLLTTPALTPEQRSSAVSFLGPGRSWSLGAGVDDQPELPYQAPGRWGWTGGTGTTADVDPSRDTVAVLLTQKCMGGPDDGFDEFWSAVAS